ncbi:hypothetical protein [Flammeovirga sp. OC4]|uniref:hypothetical protein n=1 Tax=Flammeovirga sp. OC4 TaxID=1382345 RepID=UPI0005C50B18|nr:hypothetical protein [Flammeovirga sp. OC4]
MKNIKSVLTLLFCVIILNALGQDKKIKTIQHNSCVSEAVIYLDVPIDSKVSEMSDKEFDQYEKENLKGIPLRVEDVASKHSYGYPKESLGLGICESLKVFLEEDMVLVLMAPTRAKHNYGGENTDEKFAERRAVLKGTRQKRKEFLIQAGPYKFARYEFVDPDKGDFGCIYYVASPSHPKGTIRCALIFRIEEQKRAEKIMNKILSSSR